MFCGDQDKLLGPLCKYWMSSFDVHLSRKQTIKIENTYFFKSKLIERLKVKLLFLLFEKRQIKKNLKSVRI